MNYYNVLMLDDDERLLKEAQAPFQGEIVVKLKVETEDSDQTLTETISGVTVRLTTVNNSDKALKLLKSNFYHLALVDPRLTTNDNDFDGIVFLRHLKQKRPTCVRVIHTDYGRNHSQGMESVVSTVDPLTGNANHIMTKTFLGCAKVLEQRAARWLANPITVDQPELYVQKIQTQIFDREPKKAKASDAVDVTRDEVDYLVSSLFGQGVDLGEVPGSLDIKRIECLKFIGQGHSQAVVARVVSHTPDAHRGIECILKFARRHYIRRELARYYRYVRFRLNVQRRVELLSWKFGDTVGVLCYHFASEDSLATQFLRARDQPPVDGGYAASGFARALHRLFAVAEKKWYGEAHTVSLIDYFTSSPYNLDMTEMRRSIERFAERIRDEFGERTNGTDLVICGVNLGDYRNLLNDACKNPFIARHKHGCIVHGDLHCDNVLIDSLGNPNFIDYYTVGPGPRVIDFAALEASVRLLTLKRIAADGTIVDLLDEPDKKALPKDEYERRAAPYRDEYRVLLTQVVGTYETERRIGDSTWRGAAPPSDDYWASASLQIAAHAKENCDPTAETDPPGLEELEYAATCFLRAVYLFRIGTVKDMAKVRLLVWILALARQLQYQ